VRFNHQIYLHPAELHSALKEYFVHTVTKASIHSMHSEDAVLLEAFVHGNEFSCGVIQTPKGESVALPPTEIVIDESVEVFDFNAKYKSKLTRKRIPMDASLAHLQQIQKQVKQAFDDLGFGVCTRIDGFLTADGVVVLHDPNTIPGMSPSSLIFKQMAEIGLTVTDSITYFIRQSIRERMRNGKNYHTFRKLLEGLDQAISEALSLKAAQETELIVIDTEDLENSFESAKQAAARIAALGNQAYKVIVPLEIEEAEIEYVVHVAQLAKESGKELMESIHQGVHPLIAHTRQAGSEITAFYTR
jgi:D-alanine-D-alanine ligase